MRTAFSAIAALALLGCARTQSGIQGTGTIEYMAVDVAPLIAARVVTVAVEEGDEVSAGQVIATLSNTAAAPEVEAREASVRRAEAQLRDLEAGARGSEIQQSVAQAAAARAEAAQAARDAERARSLFDAGAVSRQEMELAQTRARAAASQAEALRAATGTVRAGSRPATIRAAAAEVEAARASLDAARRAAGELSLQSPIRGRVTIRVADPGEIVPAGAPVVTVARTDSLWVRIYLNQRDFAAVSVGDEAVALLDGDSRRFAGRVVSLAERAEFTPRIALTERERADLLFGVKVLLQDATGTLKAGLPVTVRITPRAR
ncbi:MAG TPA: HlyD family efflux transporter periplasmic adaptor subunit [Gemmatimonadaceae bacterium]|nr:HlyD family efflux transporter periplasmic adaptor subunit [Gemmatimonadaceae bacterium]